MANAVQYSACERGKLDKPSTNRAINSSWKYLSIKHFEIIFGCDMRSGAHIVYVLCMENILLFNVIFVSFLFYVAFY